MHDQEGFTNSVHNGGLVSKNPWPYCFFKSKQINEVLIFLLRDEYQDNVELFY
jgi:hypothetical protein